jgi:glycosyltransferase involved in cell wall biosynthesis
MNILFLNSIGADKYGGGEKWMLKASKGLADAGHNVILSSKKNSEIIKRANEAGVRTKVFNIRSDFSPVNTLKIAKFLKKEEIEILICNLNKDVRVAGLAAKKAKTPVVIARHGLLLCAKKWKHKVTLTNLVDNIITNSITIKNTYLSYGWFKEDFVKVVYNGIEDKSHVEAYDFSSQFPGKKIIFSAGRISGQKGFSYLIEAASLLKRKRDDLMFLIAGKGKLEALLKRQVKKMGVEDSVRFIGFTNNIDPYIKGSDLYVLSSLQEGMPNVVMEAMAVGKAVLATDVNGVRELMVDAKTGIIVPPADGAALAKSIDSIIDDRQKLKMFGEAGCKRVNENFTIPIMVKNLENYFTALLEKNKTGL